MKLQLFRQIFEKYSNIKFHEYPSSGSRPAPLGRTDGRTDMTKLTVAFRNFANAYKNSKNTSALSSASIRKSSLNRLWYSGKPRAISHTSVSWKGRVSLRLLSFEPPSILAKGKITYRAGCPIQRGTVWDRLGVERRHWRGRYTRRRRPEKKVQPN